MNQSEVNQPVLHQPVLLRQVIEVLDPQPGETYLDGTAGYGGHAAPILALLGLTGQAFLVDRDANATQALARRFGEGAVVIHADFLEAADRLLEEGRLVDMILLDLGVSSPQLDNAGRGFSFKADAPLDMRMDRSQSYTAADVVNRMSERELERIIRTYGEEPKARAVARALVAARPFATTGELAKVVRSAALKGDIDAATRTFQAIRIEVNGELDLLQAALPKLTKLLSSGGRLVIISFHSLEDRIVKQFFEYESRDCICPPKQPVCTCDHVAGLRKITVKPIVSDSDEIAINPRARSAKLRAAEKINKNKRRD
ncbi:MAG TPA: 16S rRNA (cytosine(1402)-N(4))-methyltransferase RsmH [Candidatus Saccharimonadia bacterium]|nr:16S rRNA (cytosine(1402)-N(4))-methyltransferase RsmH [Candidatus Saccharimonadia bacterium]